MVIFHGYVSLPEGKLFEHVESPFLSSHVLIRVLELLDQRDGVRFSNCMKQVQISHSKRSVGRNDLCIMSSKLQSDLMRSCDGDGSFTSTIVFVFSTVNSLGRPNLQSRSASECEPPTMRSWCHEN